MRQLPSAQGLDVPTLNDHIPDLLRELVAALRSGSEETIPEALVDGTPPTHGIQRVEDGFDIEEVVAEYNILRGCIHDLAHENGLSLQGKPFHVLNRVLDEAIGQAVHAFAARKAFEVQQRREEYLAFVAHDLRNPLNAIALATLVLETTLAPGGDAPRVARLLRTMKRNVNAMDALVGKVIEENTNVRTEAGIAVVCRDFDLWPLVEALFQDLQSVAEASRTRLTNAVPDDFVVCADASLLKRVFRNLIANAISYTPGGEVVVGVGDAGADGAVECFVRDDGQGIPADRLDSVFDKYETDPEKEGGEGLGLAIVKSFVEAHGGTVSVESKPGAGSTFRFTLPKRPR